MSHRHAHGGHAGHAHGDDPFLSEEMARRWQEWDPVLDPATEALSETLLDAARVTAGTRVLDAACGLGPTTAAAHARDAHAVGIDLNPAMVDGARQRHPGVAFRVHDMMDLPDAPWDAVVCRFGAHHVDADAWFAHVRASLRPGGRLAVAEWGHGNEVPLFPEADPDHMAFTRSPEQWADALRAAGFTDVSVQRVDVPMAFGDEATWHRFLREVHGMDAEDAARTHAHLQDGVQHNAAHVVAGTA